MKKYFEEVDVLKGIAILLVLLGHSFILYPINLLNYSWCNTIFEYIHLVHMELFFLISGFCYSKKSTYKEYINLKIKRILIPYIIFGIIDLFPRYLFPQLINGNESISDSIKSMLLYGGKLWFLYALFIIFMIYPLFDKYIKSKYTVFIVILCLVSLELIPITNLFLLKTIIKFLKYFILGSYIRKVYNSNLKEKLRKPQILLVSILTFILSGFLPSISYLDFIKGLLGIIMLYIICCFILNYKIKYVLSDFGKYSLQLYLLNGYMLVIARVFFVNILNITEPFILVSLIFISNGIIGIVLSKYILNRFKFTKYISGIPIK